MQRHLGKLQKPLTYVGSLRVLIFLKKMVDVPQ